MAMPYKAYVPSVAQLSYCVLARQASYCLCWWVPDKYIWEDTCVGLQLTAKHDRQSSRQDRVEQPCKLSVVLHIDKGYIAAEVSQLLLLNVVLYHCWYSRHIYPPFKQLV